MGCPASSMGAASASRCGRTKKGRQHGASIGSLERLPGEPPGAAGPHTATNRSDGGTHDVLTCMCAVRHVEERQHLGNGDCGTPASDARDGGHRPVGRRSQRTPYALGRRHSAIGASRCSLRRATRGVPHRRLSRHVPPGGKSSSACRGKAANSSVHGATFLLGTRSVRTARRLVRANCACPR